MKQDDYDILNMSDEEITELELEMMECENDAVEQKQRNKKILLGVIIGVVLLLVAVFCVTKIFSCSLFESGSKKKIEFVESAAQQIISEQLRASSTARWNDVSYIEDNGEKYIVYADFEAQNGFGGYVRTRCFVVVENIDLNAGTFNYNGMVPYIECSGKNDTNKLNFAKSFYGYNKN